MREEVRDPGRLEHILMAIDNVVEFTNGISYEDFIANKQTFYATTYNIQIVGEAAYMLSNEFKQNHSEVDWAIIEKMRHVIVHGYYKVSYRVVWNVATEDIPILRPQIKRMLDQCRSNIE